MKYLKPLVLKDKYHKQLAEAIQDNFSHSIYQPLADIVFKYYGKEALLFRNALDPNAKAVSIVQQAIRSQKIEYDKGYFRGDFTANISKSLKEIGAKWSGEKKGFFIPRERLPQELAFYIADADLKYQTMCQELMQELAKNVKYSSVDLAGYFAEEIVDLTKDFNKSVESITIPPKVTPRMDANLAKSYNKNINLYIKDWIQDSTERLREKIRKAAFSGHRAKSLVEMIQADFQVSRNKAEFLARQETSLLMSKFRQERFASVGVVKYKWSTSKDSRVRTYHKLLDGRIFFFASPPVVDKNGNRKNAGEDYGCRCIAIPIVD